MAEGTRFDQLYETMPWHKVDTVVFDIGNVLIRFAPESFTKVLFPGDPEKQEKILREVYHGKYWIEFDRGTISYQEAAQAIARVSLPQERTAILWDYAQSMLNRKS